MLRSRLPGMVLALSVLLLSGCSSKQTHHLLPAAPEPPRVPQQAGETEPPQYPAIPAVRPASGAETR